MGDDQPVCASIFILICMLGSVAMAISLCIPSNSKDKGDDTPGGIILASDADSSAEVSSSGWSEHVLADPTSWGSIAVYCAAAAALLLLATAAYMFFKPADGKGVARSWRVSGDSNSPDLSQAPINPLYLAPG